MESGPRLISIKETSLTSISGSFYTSGMEAVVTTEYALPITNGAPLAWWKSKCLNKKRKIVFHQGKNRPKKLNSEPSISVYIPVIGAASCKLAAKTC